MLIHGARPLAENVWPLRVVLPLLLCGAIHLSVTAPMDAQTVIRFATWGSGEEAAIWERDIASFERENPDIKVELYLTDWTTYWQRLPLILSGNVEMDIVRIGGQHLPTFATQGYLMPFTELEERGLFDRSPFFPPVLETTIFDGSLYGLPDHFSPLVLFFNFEMFERHGLENPHALHQQNAWTWSTFEEVVRKLTVDRSGDGAIDQWGIPDGFAPNQPHLRQAMILMNGGREFNITLTESLLHEPASVEALQWLADLRPYRGGSWTAGQVGMVSSWPSALRSWKDAPIDIGTSPLPRPDGKDYATVMTSNIMSILSSSKEPEASLRFINYIVDKEIQLLRADDNYIVSARIDVANESLEEGRLAARFTPVIAEITAFTRPWDVPLFHYDTARQLIDSEILRAARGEEAVPSAATRISQMVNALIRSNE